MKIFLIKHTHYLKGIVILIICVDVCINVTRLHEQNMNRIQTFSMVSIHGERTCFNGLGITANTPGFYVRYAHFTCLHIL